MVRILKGGKVECRYTSRFGSSTDAGCIRLDLRRSETWTEMNRKLLDHEFDVFVLSASETLHFDDSRIDASKSDWTGDFVRPNSGIWHKCIDELDDDEISSPIDTNIIGNVNLIRHYVKGLEAHPDRGSANKMIIVVTSSEGAFIKKGPFHPVTNATKSALEQVVHTVSRQAETLGFKIVTADPGWVYTESSRGKTKGPVDIKFGAHQILHPLAVHISGGKVKNGSMWRRLDLRGSA